MARKKINNLNLTAEEFILFYTTLWVKVVEIEHSGKNPESIKDYAAGLFYLIKDKRYFSYWLLDGTNTADRTIFYRTYNNAENGFSVSFDETLFYNCIIYMGYPISPDMRLLKDIDIRDREIFKNEIEEKREEYKRIFFEEYHGLKVSPVLGDGEIPEPEISDSQIDLPGTISLPPPDEPSILEPFWVYIPDPANSSIEDKFFGLIKGVFKAKVEFNSLTNVKLTMFDPLLNREVLYDGEAKLEKDTISCTLIFDIKTNPVHTITFNLLNINGNLKMSCIYWNSLKPKVKLSLPIEQIKENDDPPAYYDGDLDANRNINRSINFLRYYNINIFTHHDVEELKETQKWKIKVLLLGAATFIPVLIGIYYFYYPLLKRVIFQPTTLSIWEWPVFVLISIFLISAVVAIMKERAKKNSDQPW